MKRNNYSLLKCLFYSILLGSFLFVGKANAQTRPTSQDLIFSYSFANLAHNSSTYPTGFQGWKIANSSGTSFKTVAPIANTSLIANGSASSTAGGVYNYNGKIGMLASTSIDPAIVTCVNTSGFTDIIITVDIMTIRNPYDGTNNTRLNNVELQYRADTANGTFTSLSGSIYRNNTTTQTGSGVTTPQNLQTVTVALPASCENLETVQIRIVQRDSTGSGARPSFAIDNICITGTSTISSSGSTTFCSGGSVELTAINGTSWLWSNNDTTQSITVSSSGSYNVTVTETAGCSSLATAVNVTVNSFNYHAVLLNESVGTVSQNTSISDHENNNGFDNDNLTMSGTADIRITTPSSGYTGASGGANVFFALTHATDFKISGINTSYFENVNLEFGLYKSRTAYDGTEFIVEVSTNDTNYTQLEFDPLPTGTGTAIWHYVQINDYLPVSENLFIRFSSSDTATYFRLDDIKLIGDIENSYILANGLETYCAGDTITLTASEGVEYLWSTSDTVQVINITESGNYYVTVTDNNGCTGVANINISLPDSLAITDTIVNVTCFGQSNGSIDLTITGGTSPFTYLWSNDSTTQDLNNIPAGNYIVTVTDSHGCTIIDSMIVTEPEIPLIEMYGGFCGMVNVELTDTLYSDTLTCASQYQFHIFNSSFNYSLSSNTTALYLSQVVGLENNTVYGITVRIIVGNDTASYGDTCYFRTKTIPPYGQGYSLYSTTTTDTLTGEETHDPMYVYDMYGNNYLLEDIVIPENSDIAGIFRLHFADEMYDTDPATGTNDGFNDPALGQQRKNVLIRVFEDISELITQNGVLPNPYPDEAAANPCNDPEGAFPACRFIEINVQRSSYNNDSTAMTAAGTGSQFYGPELGEGIVFGNVWEYVNTGYDPYFNLSNVPFGTTQYYHGQVRINFDNLGYNWNLNLAQPANPVNNEIDLYTVMLHEIIHMLGFGSLIDSDGSSKSFVGEGQYSIYDTYLQLSGNDMISSDGCYSTNFEANPLNMNVSCISNMLFTGSSPSTVVYTSSPFSGGSSFSHFNCQNDSGYVMNPGISVGYTQRSPNEREVQALCALGYNVSGTYGTGVAWNGTAIPAVNYTTPCFVSREVAGLNDFNEYSSANATNLYNVEAGQPITINATGATNSILDNDINATKISCVEVILGGNSSTLNLAGLPNSFVYTPPANFVGTAIIKYIPENNEGDRGNITYIYLMVTHELPVCEADYSCDENLVCYGGFEEFMLVADMRQNLTEFHTNQPFRFNDLFTDNTPDMNNNIIPGFQNCNGLFNNNMSAHTGNNYLKLVVRTYDSGVNYPEGPAFKLSRPVQPGATGEIHLFGSTASCEDVFVSARLTNIQPCPNLTLENCAGLIQSNLFNSNDFTPCYINDCDWQEYVINFVNNTNENMNYLIINSNTSVLRNGSVGHPRTWLFIDDVTLFVDEIPVTITSNVSDTIPCVGDTISIQYTICNNGVNPADTVQFQYNIPYGITLIPDTNFDSNGIVSILPTDWVDSCIVMNLNLVVNNNAVAGSPITNTIMTLPGACITEGAVTDTIIPGRADVLTISKTSNKPAYSAGDNVTYNITVCNIGNFDINNIVINDTLVNVLSFISSDDFTLNAGVLHSDSLSIALGQCITLHYIAQIDQSFTGDSITNCAAIILADGVCDIPIENCHTIYMCDTNFAVTLTPLDISCLNSEDGEINATVSGGITPYTYIWSNDAETEDIQALEQGIYTLTVTDSYGCTVSENATVNEPTQLSVSITPTFISGTCQSTANALAVGGTVDYSYLWSINAQTSAMATGLCANTNYYVTVTDANGCTAIDTININNAVTCTVNTSPSSCGDSSGVASVDAIGGTAPYTYLWSNNETTDFIDSLTYGTYFITVTDNLNDTATCSALVDNESTITVTVNVTNELCSSYNDGVAIASVNGGCANCIYAWTVGGNIIYNDTITGLNAGNYIVTITDTNGTPETSDDCKAYELATIGTSFATTITTNHLITCHDNCNGVLTANLPNGFNDVSILWNNDSTTQSINSLCAGSYAVTITNNDTTNCTATASASLTNPDTLALDLTYRYCFEAKPSRAIAAVTGGVPNYSFLWTGGGTNDTLNLNETFLETNGYTINVTVTDHYNCSIIDSFTIVTAYEGDIMVIDHTEDETAYCGNCNGVGKVLMYAVPNVDPLTFMWDGIYDTGTIPHYDYFCEGWHYVVVSDVNHCTINDSVYVHNTNPNPRSINISASNPDYCMCNGNIEILGYTNMISPYQYNWTNGGSYTATTEIISWLCPGDYIVTVTDSRGCDVIDTASINYPDSLETSLTINDSASCYGYCNGNATVTATGAHTPFTYLWDNGETTATADSLCAGQHSVTVTDSNSCSVIEYFSIGEPDAITFSLTSVDPICGFSNGSAEAINIQGGTGSYSFNWTGSRTTNPITALAADTYNVTVSDANNCTATSSVTLVCEEYDIDLQIAGSTPMTTTHCAEELLGVSVSYPLSNILSEIAIGNYQPNSTCGDFASYSVWLNQNCFVPPSCWDSQDSVNAVVDYHYDYFHFIWNWYPYAPPYQHDDYAYYGMCNPTDFYESGNDPLPIFQWSCRNDVYMLWFVPVSETYDLTEPYPGFAQRVNIEGSTFSNLRVVSCGLGYDPLTYSIANSSGSMLVDVNGVACRIHNNYSNGYIIWKQPGTCYSCGALSYTGTYPFASYQWYRNGTLLTGETNSTLNVSDGNYGNGDYYLVATDAYSNTFTSDTLTVNLCPQAKNMTLSDVAVENTLKPLEVNVFPNPNTGKFRLIISGGETENLKENDNFTDINIYDMMGKSVYEIKIEKEIADFDLSGLSNGLYFIKVHKGKDFVLRKVIINY